MLFQEFVRAAAHNDIKELIRIWEECSEEEHDKLLKPKELKLDESRSALEVAAKRGH